MYNTFIFDFDFTLADASPAIIESANYALARLGFEPKPPEDIKQTIGMTLHGIFTALTGISDGDMPDLFFNHFKAKADEIMADGTVLFNDTIDVLTHLKIANYKTAIVTTKMRYRIEEILKKFKISHLVDFIVGFEDVEQAKPDPEGLIKAIEALGSLKEETLYTGDSHIDAKAAAAAGIDFAAVLTGTTAREEFEALSHVVIAGNLMEVNRWQNKT
ncbi:MAG: HAD-IA family hydrolase [Clostridiales bacterium]|jgi:phosphoglycolate phosphatase|nr:HAD-IA family hydrolase [Clostridiales bacterium]